MVTGQEDLAVTVAAAFPLALSRPHIDAGHDPLVQTVDVAFVKDRAVEFVLHPVVFPDGPSSEASVRFGDFYHRCAMVVTCRDEEAIFVKYNRLRRVDVVRGPPRVIPQQGAVFDCHAHSARGAHDQDLPPAGQRDQHG